MNEIKIALKTLLEAVFPNSCCLCGEVIELGEKLCDECLNLPRIKSPICDYCGVSKEDCNCKKHKNEYEKIVAPFYYRDRLVTIVHNFKKRDMLFLADGLGVEISNSIKEHYTNINFDYVCFVPFTKIHYLRKGYNQAELLANVVGSNIDVKVCPLLVKNRYTGVQHKKNAKERKADSFGAYDVADEYKNIIAGKTILLIDDIKTTGATLNECAKMLNIYGAEKVYCATLAITNGGVSIKRNH